MKKIYLDYAAATPMCPEAIAAMQPFFANNFHNPSATYSAGRAARQALNDQRSKVAQCLGARPAEVIFTAGATEANNLAIQGVLGYWPDGEVIVSAIEHESVIALARYYKNQLAPVDNQGLIILNKLSNLITDKTVLISVMLVNNELGTIQPLSKISELVKAVVKERRKAGNQLPLYVHTDAAQAANYLDVHVSRLGVDLMSLNGGKIHGPKQSGCLYVKAGTRLRPLVVGGGQEFGLRSGTENIAAAAGFAAALERAAANRTKEVKRLADSRTKFEVDLISHIPSAHINGSAKHRAPHITSLTIGNADAERLMLELDERGIECAVGSACSASSDEPSHVLKAIGLTNQQARSTLRFSLGAQTDRSSLDKVVSELGRLTASNR